MNKWEVVKCSMGGTKIQIGTGTRQDCIAYCNDHNWQLDDGYVCYLEVREIR